MKSASFSADGDKVLEFLGDKVLATWASAVAKAAGDLAEYRSALPSLAAANSPRGLANLIHDWLWQHLRAETDDLEEVSIYEIGPTREMVVRGRVRIRVKRHHGEGAVASYPTIEALRFYRQHPPTRQLVLFEDLPEVVNLVFGYTWHRDVGEIGAATVSYPVSRSLPLWLREITPDTPSGIIAPSRPDAPVPTVGPLEGKGDVRRDSEA